MTRPRLFESTAWYYGQYRPAYPGELIERVVDEFDLDGKGRLLDLGCGTGLLSIPLAPHFESTVGLDPDADMLSEAGRTARSMGIADVCWALGDSEDLNHCAAGLGRFRLVTMGNSFHWTEREATLEALRGLIDPDGGIAVIDFGGSVWSETEEWHRAATGVIRRWLGDRRRAGPGSTYTDPDERHEAVVARSPFQCVRVVNGYAERTLTLDEVVGGLYSTSFASKALLGDKQTQFEIDLRSALIHVATDGKFHERSNYSAILGRLD